MNNILKIVSVVGVLAVLLLVAYNFIPKSTKDTPSETAVNTQGTVPQEIPVPQVPTGDEDNATAPTNGTTATTTGTDAAATAGATTAPTASPLDASIEAYIKAHPEVIIDAVTQYQQDQVRKQAEQSEKFISSKWTELTSSTADPVAGNPKGDVTIVEFFDYSCGYCKHVLPYMLKVLETDPNVRIIFKEFPILSPNSEIAAKVALAAYQVNPAKYLEFHKALFNARLTSEKSALEVATSVGLDAKVLEEKMKTPEIQAALTATRQFALEAGVRGTPAFVINGKLIPGVADLESLQALIKAAREKK